MAPTFWVYTEKKWGIWGPAPHLAHHLLTFSPNFMMRMEHKVITVLDNQTIISQLLQPAGEMLDINPHCFEVVAYKHFFKGLMAGNSTANSQPECHMIACYVGYTSELQFAFLSSFLDNIPHVLMIKLSNNARGTIICAI